MIKDLLIYFSQAAVAYHIHHLFLFVVEVLFYFKTSLQLRFALVFFGFGGVKLVVALLATRLYPRNGILA